MITGLYLATAYCRTEFDSDSLTAAKLGTKIIVIIRIRYRNYTHHNLYRSCLLIYEIAIVRSLSSLLLDDLKEKLTFLPL